jgi:hypothetical protein
MKKDVNVNLLEKWIWDKYRKNIEYLQLLDASQIDTKNSSTTHLFNHKGDLLIPLQHNKDFWGQLVVKSGSDLSVLAINQIIDLTDLYFKLKVSRWTSELRAPELDESIDFIEEQEKTKIFFNGSPQIFFLKSRSMGRANYIVDFLQDKMVLQGKLPWSREYDIESESLSDLILHVQDASVLSCDDLLNWSLSQRRPHLIIYSGVALAEWHVWQQLESSTQIKLSILEADLDGLPVTLAGARDCIDMLWFAH